MRETRDSYVPIAVFYVIVLLRYCSLWLLKRRGSNQGFVFLKIFQKYSTVWKLVSITEEKT